MLRAALCVVLGASLLGLDNVFPEKTAQEIEDCVNDNLPSDSSVQEVVFATTDRSGAVKETRATIYWRKSEEGFSEIMMRVSAPPKLRGAGVLVKDKEGDPDRFLYLPALRKVRRITKGSSSEKVLGTDFTYGELERIEGIHDERLSERVDDAQVEGKTVYVVESFPAEEDDPEFTRVLTYVDTSTCVVLKAEFYGSGDKLRKVFSVDPKSVEVQAGLNVPRKMRMEDRVEGSATDLIVKSIQVGVELADKTFSRKELVVGKK
jgi:hypothetical protein